MSPAEKLFAEQPKRYIGGMANDYGEVVAPRAFRMILTIADDLTVSATKIAVINLYALFNKLYDTDAVFTSLNLSGKGSSKIKKSTAKTETEINDYITKSETFKHGTGFRRYGGVVKDSTVPTIPFFAVEHCSDNVGSLCCIECAVPADTDNYIDFITQVESIIKPLNILVGIAGFGLFLPPMLDSVNGMLINTFYIHSKNKEPVGIMTRAKLYVDAVREPVPSYYSERSITAGIPDIGWKTYIGIHLLQNNQSLIKKLKKIPQVSVDEQARYYCVTVGTKPIWGNETEVATILAAYKEAAQIIAPLYNSPTAALAFGVGFDDTYLPFFEPKYEPEKALAVIASYYNRFLS